MGRCTATLGVALAVALCACRGALAHTPEDHRGAERVALAVELAPEFLEDAE